LSVEFASLRRFEVLSFHARPARSVILGREWEEMLEMSVHMG
jgi:hypothetical protein